ncbi:MAG: hypothetical protein CM15mP12_6730 [Gammaproteobacteria bacterium]|nr:MAG: hypothetical protein CM15mP12_6730 [Gammaproteobacteria bacterium]
MTQYYKKGKSFLSTPDGHALMMKVENYGESTRTLFIDNKLNLDIWKRANQHSTQNLFHSR